MNRVRDAENTVSGGVSPQGRVRPESSLHPALAGCPAPTSFEYGKTQTWVYVVPIEGEKEEFARWPKVVSEPMTCRYVGIGDPAGEDSRQMDAGNAELLSFWHTAHAGASSHQWLHPLARVQSSDDGCAGFGVSRFLQQLRADLVHAALFALFLCVVVAQFLQAKFAWIALMMGFVADFGRFVLFSIIRFTLSSLEVAQSYFRGGGWFDWRAGGCLTGRLRVIKFRFADKNSEKNDVLAVTENLFGDLRAAHGRVARLAQGAA